MGQGELKGGMFNEPQGNFESFCFEFDYFLYHGGLLRFYFP